jgi:hypothetical protein
MGLSSTSEGEETAMAEPWLSTVETLTEVCTAAQIEASARRTKCVQQASKITGKLLLTLVTCGRWSAPKTTVAQLAATAAQVGSRGRTAPALGFSAQARTRTPLVAGEGRRARSPRPPRCAPDTKLQFTKDEGRSCSSAMLRTGFDGAQHERLAFSGLGFPFALSRSKGEWWKRLRPF